MSSDLKTPEQETDEYFALKHYIKGWYDDYKKNLKKLDDEFVAEITQEYPEWVKERRLEYLEAELNFLNEEYIGLYGEGGEAKEKIKENWLVELIQETLHEKMKSITKKIRRYNFEKIRWENPQLLWEEQGLRDDEIALAREIDLENFIEIKRISGNRKLAVCPFHDDHTPSLTIYPTNYHCFACGAHGNTVDFVMRTQHLDFPSAVRLILKYQ